MVNEIPVRRFRAGRDIRQQQEQVLQEREREEEREQVGDIKTIQTGQQIIIQPTQRVVKILGREVSEEEYEQASKLIREDNLKASIGDPRLQRVIELILEAQARGEASIEFELRRTGFALTPTQNIAIPEGFAPVSTEQGEALVNIKTGEIIQPIAVPSAKKGEIVVKVIEKSIEEDVTLRGGEMIISKGFEERAVTLQEEKSGFIETQLERVGITPERIGRLTALAQAKITRQPSTAVLSQEKVIEFQTGFAEAQTKDVIRKPLKQVVIIGVGGVAGAGLRGLSLIPVASKLIKPTTAIATGLFVGVTGVSVLQAPTVKEKGGVVGLAVKDLGLFTVGAVGTQKGITAGTLKVKQIARQRFITRLEKAPTIVKGVRFQQGKKGLDILIAEKKVGRTEIRTTLKQPFFKTKRGVILEEGRGVTLIRKKGMIEFVEFETGGIGRLLKGQPKLVKMQDRIKITKELKGLRTSTGRVFIRTRIKGRITESTRVRLGRLRLEKKIKFEKDIIKEPSKIREFFLGVSKQGKDFLSIAGGRVKALAKPPKIKLESAELKGVRITKKTLISPSELKLKTVTKTKGLIKVVELPPEQPLDLKIDLAKIKLEAGKPSKISAESLLKEIQKQALSKVKKQKAKRLDLPTTSVGITELGLKQAIQKPVKIDIKTTTVKTAFPTTTQETKISQKQLNLQVQTVKLKEETKQALAVSQVSRLKTKQLTIQKQPSRLKSRERQVSDISEVARLEERQLQKIGLTQATKLKQTFKIPKTPTTPIIPIVPTTPIIPPEKKAPIISFLPFKARRLKPLSFPKLPEPSEALFISAGFTGRALGIRRIIRKKDLLKIAKEEKGLLIRGIPIIKL